MVIGLNMDYRATKMATTRWLVKVGLRRWLMGCVGNGIAGVARARQGVRGQVWCARCGMRRFNGFWMRRKPR